MSAAFSCSFEEYAATSANEKLGILISSASQNHFASHFTRQTTAWEEELAILGDCIAQLISIYPESRNWRLLLEYSIPRRGKRPDVIVLANDLILVIEFKTGAVAFSGADQWQALSYALDLRDFHSESSCRRIVPILIGTGIDTEFVFADSTTKEIDSLLPVQNLWVKEGSRLAAILLDIYQREHIEESVPIDEERWEASAYRPSPNIIEAAESLFAGHSVADISHGFAFNLQTTSKTVIQAIEEAQRERKRTICFVTGIPGAGKTLAGLNAVHDPSLRRNDRPSATFLSGNRPLVNVIREALTRNRVAGGIARGVAKQAVSAFINYVHGFLETYGIQRPAESPYEHTIIFDEAQRAWDSAAVARNHGVAKSEAELILEIMQRAPDWCVVVALVGGGQEIHKGEAGLAEWGRALNASSTQWKVMASSEVIQGGISVAGHRLFAGHPSSHLEIVESRDLHLDVGVRSPRAGWLGEWVNSFLTSEILSDHMRSHLVNSEFPIALTRDLAAAKGWLRERTDGNQRCGLLASSGALRLRPHGIEVSSSFRKGYSYEDWFLSGPKDCRSSYWLEVAATEFECQGLELDWAGVCWGGDLIYSPEICALLTRRFHGNRWLKVHDSADHQFLLNKYRVLLTRARRGMVIWVPEGDESDPTRSPEELNATADFLLKCGIPLLSN